MSFTKDAQEYFSQVAGDWESIRSGYFGDEIRQAAIRKAYLRPEMTVADIGAGTGYLTAGLAALVSQVFAIDASEAMLAVAQEKLKDFTNITYRLAEGQSLPLPADSVDAVFANMYLHHIPEPLSAIREMVRILKPGGRLVITDMDSHPYEWFRSEMADYWLGFGRSQLRQWLEQAGLVNRIVDCSGESCCAESQSQDIPDGQRSVQISVFLAVGTQPTPGALEAVGEHYGAIAQGERCGCAAPEKRPSASCCETPLISMDEIGLAFQGSAFQGSTLQSSTSQPSEIVFLTNYTAQENQAVPADAAEISLGCGNPTALAGLRAGEVVLDIGSGGGIDAFLSASKVGPSGHVIGVDMTPAMLERARQTALKSGITNVEFRQGQAEALPVQDAAVDVIISNCVINLTVDKGRVFQEAYRVLKPGGRLEISDIVTDTSFPDSLHTDLESWGGCVAGALPEQEYIDLVAQAGFGSIQVRRSTSAGTMEGVSVYSIQCSAKKDPVSRCCPE